MRIIVISDKEKVKADEAETGEGSKLEYVKSDDDYSAHCKTTSVKCLIHVFQECKS